MKQPLDDQQLKQWIQHGDPANEMTPLADHERSLLLQRILLQHSKASANRPILTTRKVFVSGLIGVLLAVWFLWSLSPRRADDFILVEKAAGQSARQIHFQTPKGTRIVWVLKQPTTAANR